MRRGTETGAAPGRPCATSENIRHLPASSHGAGRDAAQVECSPHSCDEFYTASVIAPASQDSAPLAPIVIIGAGAAGLMAAIFAAAPHSSGGRAGGIGAGGAADNRAPEGHAGRGAGAGAADAAAAGAAAARTPAGGASSDAARAAAPVPVLVLERTHDGGRKILISGGGRCNVLPSELAPARFVTDSSPNTLRNLLRSWPLAEQRAFFERTLGVPLKLEAETGKLFPASDRARDIRDALVAHARRLGVTFRFGAEVTGLTPPDDTSAPWTVQLADDSRIAARAVILATGGLSVPATGSDGIGLRLLARLGHRLHDTYPALTPLLAAPAIHESLSGVSLTVTLRAAASSTAASSTGAPPAAGAAATRAMTTTGGFLFTHRGYSGPAVLDVSHLAVRARLAGRAQPILVQWTMHDEEAWHARLTPGPQTKGSLVLNRLRQLLPSRLADWLAAEADLPFEQPLATLTREQRTRLVARLCRYPLPWTSDEGYKKAEVTGGGLALDEVDPRTLQSHRHAGLFCCGELLDAFGPIGGYNFAWAWATGRLAGLGAAAAVAVAAAATTDGAGSRAPAR